MSRPNVTGIVLAGGRSSRFGADKLAVVVDGQPLLHRAMAAVAEVADEIVVVIAAEGARPRLPAGLGVPVRVVRDAAPGLGPLAGLAAGLGAARAPLAVVVGGDQPSLVPGVLAELIAGLGAGEDAPSLDAPSLDAPSLDAIGLDDDGHLRPLPAAVRVAAARPASAAALAGGTRSLIGLFARLRAGSLRAERWRSLDPGGASLLDVDSPFDLPSS